MGVDKENDHGDKVKSFSFLCLREEIYEGLLLDAQYNRSFCLLRLDADGKTESCK